MIAKLTRSRRDSELVMRDLKLEFGDTADELLQYKLAELKVAWITLLFTILGVQ